ncbi:hypothetical protein [Streptomyces lunalinharesii]|uniref:GerMN domain-containing protein n=1 Tax=Streptomyces lunalinharesii TaxID=333384 RepID=A0ABP6E9V5_9ACTN
MRRHRLGLPTFGPVLLLTLLLTGCSITDTAPTPAGSPATGLQIPASNSTGATHIYFYSAQGLERVSRPYQGPDALDVALRQLAAGPDAAERVRGLVSYVPPHAPIPVVTAHKPGELTVFAPSGWQARTALRQLVCTAADVASTQDRTSLRTLRVTVRRAAGEPTVTQTCAP